PGDTLQLASFRGRDGRCIDAQGTRTCGLEFTPGSGWQLLSGMRPESQGGGVLLNAAWLAILLLPVGFLARPRTALVLLLAMIWYIAIRLPVDTILAAAPWPEIVGSVAGVAAGLAIRRLVAPRSGPPAAPAVEETVAI
ncbi:MAG TPA: hypothetical protein VHG09_06285, partial [Longimicrobiales bacterium]|nr:hypothetical protein [Longimicrobiales bacterium]